MSARGGERRSHRRPTAASSMSSVPPPRVCVCVCVPLPPSVPAAVVGLAPPDVNVANRDSNLPDQRCKACLADPESMKHLGECSVIRRDFWDPLVNLLVLTGMTEPEDMTAFLILGRITEREYVGNHRASLLFIAWRCLYAEIISFFETTSKVMLGS